MYKIFLADDEKWEIIGLKKIIEKSHLPFEVVGQAENGVQALEDIMKIVPDLLITDIRMPGLDGLKLMERIKEEKLGTKIVLVSGYADFEYARSALRMGAVDYLLKPVEPEKLYDVLKNVMDLMNDREESAVENPTKDIAENSSMIQQVIGEIQEFYMEDITLVNLAEKYNISPGHLSTQLKEYLGMSFSKYVTTKRIQKATELLANEKLSIDEIAGKVGYNDYFYFTKVFKKVMGISPSKYRKNLS